jgi:hypothetical protein
MVMKANYELAATSEFGSNDENTNLYLLKRYDIKSTDGIKGLDGMLSGDEDWRRFRSDRINDLAGINCQ